MNTTFDGINGSTGGGPIVPSPAPAPITGGATIFAPLSLTEATGQRIAVALERIAAALESRSTRVDLVPSKVGMMATESGLIAAFIAREA